MRSAAPARNAAAGRDQRDSGAPTRSGGVSSLRFPYRNMLFAGTRLVANQALPLLSLPFTLGAVGAEKFGTMMFTQALAWYFVVLVEYGFSLTAVRFVALARNDTAALRDNMYEVLATRLLLFLASLAVACMAATLILDVFAAKCLAVAMVLVLGAAVQPIWLFQGLEEFGLISAVQVASRFACFGAIFVFVRDPGDTLLAQLLVALPFCVNAAVLLPIAIRRLGPPPRRRLGAWARACVKLMKDGADVFVGQLSTTLFSSTTTVISGAILGPVFAGYYAISEKMIRGVAMLTAPISEALYPRVSMALADGAAEDRRHVFTLLRKVIFVVGGLLGAVGVIIIFGAGVLSQWISAEGAGVHEIQLSFGWLAFIPLMIFLNNIFGVQILLGLGLKNLYRNAVLASGTAIPLLAVLLPRFWGFAGYPIALFAGEAILVALTYVLAKRHTDWKWSYASGS